MDDNFINWNEDDSAEKQIEAFRKQSISYGISENTVNAFLTTCDHLCASGREGELKSRLEDQIRVYG